MSKEAEVLTTEWSDWNEGRNSFGPGHRPDRDAHNGRSCSWRREDFYSYTTCIARYWTNDKGEKYVLVDNEGYSVTTAGHKFKIKAATQLPTFEVPYILASHAGRQNHNAEFLIKELKKEEQLAISRWKETSWYTDGANEDGTDYASWRYAVRRLYDAAADYIKLSGSTVYLEPWSVIEAYVAEARADRAYKYNHPKAVEKRARDKARKLAKEALGLF